MTKLIDPIRSAGIRGARRQAMRDRASMLPKHPVCKKCGEEFYYDFIPERNDGSGMCWFCFEAEATPTDLGRQS